METPNTINLIRSKTISSPQHDAIAESLKKSGLIMIILFISIGLLVGVLNILFSTEEKNLLTQKEQYSTRIENDREIEGFFRSIKDRTHIVRLTIESKKPWSQLLDQVKTIAAPPELMNIAVDEHNIILLTISAESVDSIVPIANSLIAQAEASRLTQPQLVSLNISKTGKVTASFSFIAVF
jgi:flagellar basal body-associated protein FliL